MVNTKEKSLVVSLIHNNSIFHLSLFFVLFLFLSSLSQAENIIRLNTTGQYPLNSNDRKGFMDVIAKKAFNQIGFQLETIQLPAERGLINVNSGLEDGEMSRIAGLEKFYPNLIQIPEKIMDWEFVAFSRKKIDLSQGWQSLSSYSIAIINGWKILENNVPVGTELSKVKNPTQLFALLTLNRTEIILYEKWAGLALLKKNNSTNIRLLSPVLAKREMYIYLHKKHQHLIAPLNESLKGLKRSGEYERIYHDILTPFVSN